MNILITRPEHDDTTYYLSHWSKKILDFAKKKGEKIFDLNRERAIKKEVTSFLSKKNPGFVIFNGHGDDVREIFKIKTRDRKDKSCKHKKIHPIYQSEMDIKKI